MLSHLSLGWRIGHFDKALWLRFLLPSHLSLVTGGTVVHAGIARSTRRFSVNVHSNRLLVTPTNVVNKVRAYRHSACRWHRNYRPCPPKGEGALSFSFAL